MIYTIVSLVLAFVVYQVLRHGGSRAGSSAGTSSSSVTVREISSVLDRVRQSGREGAFAAFIVSDPSRPAAEPVNVQFSVENDTVGFDWLLMQSLNIADEDRFLRLADARGYSHQRLTANGVPYIRVTTGDLAALATITLTELYGLGPSDEVGIVIDGIDWP